MNVVTVSRSLELIVGMLLGGLLCWLGYRLFELGVSGTASLSAEQGQVKFQLLNASPGIFFALFGCVVIYMGISQTTKYHEKQLSGGGVEIGLEKGERPILSSAKADLERANKILYSHAIDNYKVKKYEAAANSFAALIEGSTRFADGCNALAWLYVEDKKQASRSVQLAEIAIAIKPERADFWHTLAAAYKLADRRDQAINAL